MALEDQVGPMVEEGPFPFEKVLHDELEYIAATRKLRGEREKVDDEQKGHFQRALRSNLSGLAFSGGGIRSATFNLGVLQALADLGLLKRFDYLSTVSGGGYIGSWLTALIRRTFEKLGLAKQAASEKGEAPETTSPEQAILEVEERLQTDREERIEDEALTFLRRFSNYLTPKVGLFSADTWTVITTYLRNLLLNLIVLVSAFGLALLAPRILGQTSSYLEQRWGSAWVWLCFGLAGVALLVALVHIGIHFGSFEIRNGKTIRSRLTQDRVQKWIVLPFLVAALVFTVWLEDGDDLPWWLWGLFGVGIYGAGWVLGASAAKLKYRKEKLQEMRVEWRRLTASAVAAGFVGGLGLWALDKFLSHSETTVWQGLIWGPPSLLSLFVLVGFLQTGLAGAQVHDHQREWLSRLGAWMLIYGVGWLVLFLASTASTAVFFWTAGWITATAVSGWLGVTLAGLLAGRGTERPDVEVGKTRAFIAKAAPYLFIVGLVLSLAVGLDWVLSKDGDSDRWSNLRGKREEVQQLLGKLESHLAETREDGRTGLEQITFSQFLGLQYDFMDETEGTTLATVAGVLVFLLLFFGRRVDINEFSMHRLYRNRLVRAYLGASVEPNERGVQAQPFTGFSNDDLLMGRLAPPDLKNPSHAAPLHLINTTLNLVDTTELAWQERKGASFTISTLFSGYRTAKDNGHSTDGHFGYRRTRDYGNDPKKLSLGSAFTISGAAASPNMGFRSSPALAFLLTVFNVRLGWWLGNPSQASWTLSGPRFGPLHLLYEVFGLTSDRNKYVYLSDGGHFENLGIYELVKRRCRFIIASDAGADPEATFEDLGNAIRKCRTDLGIEIELHPSSLRPSEDTRLSKWHCAVGTIRYDRRHPGEGKGTILYLKTSVTGDESEDLHNYRRQHSEFPHQSTGDQWFDESQFESYRKLGHHVAWNALEEDVTAIKISAAQKDRKANDFSVSLEQLAHRLRQRWYPPSPKKSSFTRLAASMDAIFERARLDEDLDFLDEQFYPEWHSLLTDEPWTGQPSWLPERPEQRRAGFYFCNELIQLMENVYLDLDLDHESDHPDNRGWMNLFKHWSWSAMFRATWAIACPTYGRRFQDFCEQRLGLEAYADLTVTKPIGLEEALGDDSPLNFLEKDIVKEFAENDANSIEQVVVFAVEVKDLGALVASTAAAESIEFRFGFAALTRKPGEPGEPDKDYIVAFRIQDHLRKMGLARKALEKLLERVSDPLCPQWKDDLPEKSEDTEGEQKSVETEPTDKQEMPERMTVLVPAKYRDEFSDENRTRFEALHRSVCQERSKC